MISKFSLTLASGSTAESVLVFSGLDLLLSLILFQSALRNSKPTISLKVNHQVLSQSSPLLLMQQLPIAKISLFLYQRCVVCSVLTTATCFTREVRK